MDVGPVVALDLLRCLCGWPTRLADSARRRPAVCGPTLNRGRLLRSRPGPARCPAYRNPSRPAPIHGLGRCPPARLAARSASAGTRQQLGDGRLGAADQFGYLPLRQARLVRFYHQLPIPDLRRSQIPSCSPQSDPPRLGRTPGRTRGRTHSRGTTPFGLPSRHPTNITKVIRPVRETQKPNNNHNRVQPQGHKPPPAEEPDLASPGVRPPTPEATDTGQDRNPQTPRTLQEPRSG